ncbi:hypothetical protein EQG49_00765 [Periweissella cryptocerci]|uniref:Uncharacterized protein n=1 Tax=Periweissella cryptocerci TaxID=2506420 RepID=A0A4V1AID1_9LACO|nr:hypothetical protein [Periweissella cryptocerci]QBO35085.1 hypothetical protein EQG49_00765 [Periweissella cryptocerci]
MKLTVTNVGHNELQKVITILVDDQIVVNKLLKQTETFTIEADDVTVRIGEGFTKWSELLRYIGIVAFYCIVAFGLALLTRGEGSGSGLRIRGASRTFIDEANLTFGQSDATIEYDSNNEGSIYKSPDHSVTIRYRQVSTKVRVLWVEFKFLMLIGVFLLIDYGLIVLIHGVLGVAAVLCAAGPLELVGAVLMLTSIKKARKYIIKTK